jgi:hypothetical protein
MKDLRLLAHVRLEGADGSVLADINIDQWFQEMFSGAGDDENSIRRTLEALLTSPIRALLRAHMKKLEEARGYRRLDLPSTEEWLDEETNAELEQTFLRMHHERRLEELD